MLAQKPAILDAIEHAKTMGEAETGMRKALDAAQAKHQAREQRSKALAMLRTKAEGLRPQAGDAALRAAGLKQRFGLSEAVPCRGTDLQPRCQQTHSNPTINQRVVSLRNSRRRCESLPRAGNVLQLAPAIAAGANHTCALMSGGALKCWVYNYYGQVGDNKTSTRLTPVDASALAAPVTAGTFHTCALTGNGWIKFGVNGSCSGQAGS